MTDEQPKTKEDIKNLLKHLEDEYRKANITEKTYKEMKEKYNTEMKYLENTIAPEELQPAAAAPAEKKEEKKGFLGKLLHHEKKEDKAEEKAEGQPVAEQPAPAEPEPVQEETPQTEVQTEEEKPAAVASETEKAVSLLSIEIEKLKAVFDAVREQKKGTDESIQRLFEDVGETRSMSIQNDAVAREISSKMERIEEQFAKVNPQEVDKRFHEIADTLEKYQTSIEKIEVKTNDMAERLNKTYDILKAVGNIENLVKLNDEVQKKLVDITEAERYVERLSAKSEKIFLDLKKDLEDMIVYRSKQEAADDSIKDLIKTADGINIKFEGYTTRKDFDDQREDLMLVKKEMDNVKKTLAIVQSSVPEPIANLRKQREDIKIFLDSLEEQERNRKIKQSDYDSIRSKNEEKLKTIETQISEEWKKFEALMKASPQSVDGGFPPVQEKKVEEAKPELEEKKEVQPEEEKPAEVASDKQEGSGAPKKGGKRRRVEVKLPF